MLSHLGLTHFGPIAQADFDFCPGVNVLVGENGTGKSLALRAAWLALSQQAPGAASKALDGPHPVDATALAHAMLERFIDLAFRSEFGLGAAHELIAAGQTQAEWRAQGDAPKPFHWACDVHRVKGCTVTRDEVGPGSGRNAPVLLPAHEKLSIQPGELPLLKRHTYVVPPSTQELTASVAIRPIAREALAPALRRLVEATQTVLGGQLPEVGADGTITWVGRPISLMAEGHRKLGAAAMLLANESIQPGDTLLWDEPEANLNPKLVAFLANWMADLAAAGVQVILSTHSLFLLRAFEIARKTKPGLPVRFFALHHSPEGVLCESADDLLSVRHLSSLDAELTQEDEYLALP